MEAGKVSVVIPTYNRAYCLAVAIGSVQAQTYSAWEALIIDDGSTDQTESLVRCLSRSDPRVKYYRQEKNHGVSAARNAAIRMADGEWIAFLDSDDSWKPWKLSAQVACLKSLPDVGMIWTDMDGYDQNGVLVSPQHLRRMYTAYKRVDEKHLFAGECPLSKIAPELTATNVALAGAVVRWGELYSAMIFGNLVHTSTVLIARQRLRQVGLFNEQYRSGEDYDFHLRTCLHGPVAFLDVASTRYRAGEEGDQLTAQEYQLQIAINALQTREKAIACNRQHILLSDDQLAAIMARANTSVAETLFAQGDFSKARAYFRKGRLLQSRKLSPIVKASLSHLPPRIVRSVVGLLRKSKARAREWSGS